MTERKLVALRIEIEPQVVSRQEVAKLLQKQCNGSNTAFSKAFRVPNAKHAIRTHYGVTIGYVQLRIES